MLTALKKHKLFFLFVALFCADFAYSFLSHCAFGDPQQNAKCANNHYGVFDTVTFGFFAWFTDFVDRKHDLVLGLATIVIAWFTATIWGINKRQLDHARQVERAYMSAGGGPSIEKFKGVDGETISRRVGNKFEIHVNNHGKTPGRLLRIAIEFYEAGSPPTRPDYHPVYHGDWIGPGTQSRLIKRIDMPTGLQNPIVYGRIWYTDIFSEVEHSSGFIQDIDLPTGRSMPYEPPSHEYVDYS